jgi:hypothetical protein
MGEQPALSDQEIALISSQRVPPAVTGSPAPAPELWDWLTCWTG